MQWGDTLSGIAARYGTTITHLAAINGISPFGVLLAGSHLRVPGSAAAPAMAAGGSFDAVGSLDLWSAHYGVDPRLARAVAWMESGYNTGAVSSVGAWGVMQVMPATWRFTERLIGHPVARTPDGNVRIGVAYLHHLLNVFGGDQRLALAAYYQGPGRRAAVRHAPGHRALRGGRAGAGSSDVDPRSSSVRWSRWLSTDAVTWSQSVNTASSAIA